MLKSLSASLRLPAPFRIFRAQAPAIYLVVALSGFIAGESGAGIMLSVITVALFSIGIWALDDYVDRDLDVVLHPRRVIPSGDLSPRAVLEISAFSLSLSLSSSILKLIFLGDAILAIIVLIELILGILAVELTREDLLDHGSRMLLKALLTGAMISLIFPAGGGLSHMMIILGLMVGMAHIANTLAVHDKKHTKTSLTKILSPSLYLASMISGWIAYLAEMFHKLTMIPLTLISISELILMMEARRGMQRLRARLVAGIGKISTLAILLIEALL